MAAKITAVAKASSAAESKRRSDAEAGWASMATEPIMASAERPEESGWMKRAGASRRCRLRRSCASWRETARLLEIAHLALDRGDVLLVHLDRLLVRLQSIEHALIIALVSGANRFLFG